MPILYVILIYTILHYLLFFICTLYYTYTIYIYYIITIITILQLYYLLYTYIHTYITLLLILFYYNYTCIYYKIYIYIKERAGVVRRWWVVEEQLEGVPDVVVGHGGSVVERPWRAWSSGGLRWAAFLHERERENNKNKRVKGIENSPCLHYCGQWCLYRSSEGKKMEGWDPVLMGDWIEISVIDELGRVWSLIPNFHWFRALNVIDWWLITSD